MRSNSLLDHDWSSVTNNVYVTYKISLWKKDLKFPIVYPIYKPFKIISKVTVDMLDNM